MKTIVSKHLCLWLFTAIFMVVNCSAQSVDQQHQLFLRAVGNEFLLQLGDSNSRVLPIHHSGNSYEVSFDRLFSFEPDLLAFCAIKTLERYEVDGGYLIEVKECNQNDVVYSYMADLSQLDEEFPCKLRALPVSCYEFHFTPISLSSISKLTKENPLIFQFLVSIFLVGLGILLVVIYRSNKNNQYLKIGIYKLNKARMTLLYKGKETTLSNKEYELLKMLFLHLNETLERELLLNAIWSDEGSYIGRTLDVYISKLRKKLECDEKIKILNVRGIGYRLVIE